MKAAYPSDEKIYDLLREHGIPKEAEIWGWAVCSESEELYYTESPRISAGFLCWDMGTTKEQYQAKPFRKRSEAERLALFMPGYEVQIMISAEIDSLVVLRESEIKNYQPVESIE